MNLCSEIHSELHLAIMENIRQRAKPNCALLDVGCWDGSTTFEYGKAARAGVLCGIEIFEKQAIMAEQLGIDVSRQNLEAPCFPWESNRFDFVVCNQVLEHLKGIFKVQDEMVRVLRPGGYLILSVPNLASLHNRVMLGLGLQPSSIRVFGPHVRGFAVGEFIRFATAGGALRLDRLHGVGFYPFPASPFGNWIARVWAGGCHTPVLVLQKVGGIQFSYSEVYSNRSEQTHM
jgi:SAM-dependent methyltransferase